MFLCMVDSRARMQVWPCWRFTSMNPQAASQCEGRMPQVSQITGSPCQQKSPRLAASAPHNPTGPDRCADGAAPDAQGKGIGPLVEAAMVELQGRVVQVHAVDELAVGGVVAALVVLEDREVLQDAVLHMAHIIRCHLPTSPSVSSLRSIRLNHPCRNPSAFAHS